MALLSAPEPKVFKLLDEDTFYEAVVADIEVVPNDFYDPSEDSPDKANQLKWTFVGRDGDAEGVKWTKWTATKLSTHPKAMLIPTIKTVDPDAVIGKTFDTDTLKGKGVRILNGHKKGKKALDDGTFPVYNDIVKFAVSKLPTPPKDAVEKLLAEVASGFNGTDEDIPF